MARQSASFIPGVSSILLRMIVSILKGFDYTFHAEANWLWLFHQLEGKFNCLNFVGNACFETNYEFQ